MGYVISFSHLHVTEDEFSVDTNRRNPIGRQQNNLLSV